MSVIVVDEDDSDTRGPLGKVSPLEITITYKSGGELKFRAYHVDELLSEFEDKLKGNNQTKFKFLPRRSNNGALAETLIINFDEVVSIIAIGSSRWRAEAIYGAPDFS